MQASELEAAIRAELGRRAELVVHLLAAQRRLTSRNMHSHSRSAGMRLGHSECLQRRSQTSWPIRPDFLTDLPTRAPCPLDGEALWGNTSGFGNMVHDPTWTGNFTGQGRTEVLFYSPGDYSWWLATSSGGKQQWVLVGQGVGSW